LFVTGKESGFFVLDIDPRHQGDQSLEDMKNEYGDLPKTVEALTGGGGRHLLFQYPDNGTKICNTTKLAGFDGIDVRGDGGFIVAPPSAHISGDNYKWKLTSRPDKTSIAELPMKLLDLCINGRASKENTGMRGDLGWATQELKGVQEGKRDNTCIRLAGQLKAKGLGYDETLILLNDWGKKCTPPFPEKDVEKCVKSSYGYLEREAHSQAEVLTKAKSVALKWLKLENPNIIDIALAVIVANQSVGDPLWLLIVGAPSTGKSEILRALFNYKGTHYLGGFTRNTFASGFEKADVGLLKTLPSEVTLIIKDFGSLLSMRNDDRAEILQQLREIYDGEYRKDYGNGKVVHWRGRMGLLGAVTSTIEKHHSVIGELGNRYILFRCEFKAESRREIATMALEDQGIEQTMREEISKGFKEVLDGALDPKIIEIPDDIKEKLASIANLVSRWRSPVSRNSYNKNIDYDPDIEGPARLAKSFAKLTKGLAAVRGHISVTEEDYRTVTQVALDTIPRRRVSILKHLYENPSAGTSDISIGVNLNDTSTRRELDDLKMIGAIERKTHKKKGKAGGEIMSYSWYLSQETIEFIEETELLKQ